MKTGNAKITNVQRSFLRMWENVPTVEQSYDLRLFIPPEAEAGQKDLDIADILAQK